MPPDDLIQVPGGAARLKLGVRELDREDFFKVDDQFELVDVAIQIERFSHRQAPLQLNARVDVLQAHDVVLA